MKIVFSRKGFDSSAGGRPSPIVEGCPVSLPIPTKRRSETCYDDLELGALVTKTTNGRLSGQDLCHDDPLFADGHCWFGQCGAAQGHLAKHSVGVGDVFLFFGLFRGEDGSDRHHRIFGFMRVLCFGSPDIIQMEPEWRRPARPHPHFIGDWNRNNTIYFGQGALAKNASPSLRLTDADSPLNVWKVPDWLTETGLTFHGNPDRWLGNNRLDSAKRGQEFVANADERVDARQWLDRILADIGQ